MARCTPRRRHERLIQTARGVRGQAAGHARGPVPVADDVRRHPRARRAVRLAADRHGGVPRAHHGAFARAAGGEGDEGHGVDHAAQREALRGLDGDGDPPGLRPGLADALDAGAAASLIEAAGLLISGVPTHRKALLTATLTTTPGMVHLEANRSFLVPPADIWKNATFNWQWSADGGATWNDARSTPNANTDIAGLALMSTYSFRASVTIGKATSAWCQAVSLVVH
jgi:hypothetical protein